MGDKTEEDVSKLDLYDLLDILPDSNEKEIKKAYRKKALLCHPDKNPDNPRAVTLFHQLSKALQILTDGAARAAYDKVLKSRKASELRNKALDSKRKKLKDELEARERASQNNNTNNRDADARLQAEIERLRTEGSKHLEEEQEYIRQQLLKERNEEKSMQKVLPRLKVKWKAAKGDEMNGGYNYESLHETFVKYGEVSCLLLSSTKQGSAMVEFVSSQAAEAAAKSEKGLRTNPLKITWVQGKISSQDKPDVNDKFTGHQPSDQPVSSSTSITERDYESLVLMKMRQAEERKKLIEKMLEDEDAPEKK